MTNNEEDKPDEKKPSGIGFSFAKPALPKFGGMGLKPMKTTTARKPLVQKSAFRDEGSDDEDDYDVEKNAGKVDLHRKSVNKEIQRSETKAKMDRLMQLKIQNALEQDNKIFEYDEVYNDVSNAQKARDDEERRKKLNLSIKKPKYIKGMLKTAAKRNLESERRYERTKIRERKDEDHLFDDKDKFITPAYKEKMEKLEAAEQEQNRRDELDRLQAVHKQDGLSGFYRHMLNDQHDLEKKAKLSEEAIQKELADKIKQEEKEKAKLEAETDVKKETSEETVTDSKPAERYDSSSDSSSEDGSDCDSTGQNVDSGGSNEGNVSEPELDPETEAFNEKFGTNFNRPSHPAAPSTTMTKMSMRSRITAGGAGIETEIDWDEQLEKLNCIFRVRNSDEDVEVAQRRYFQRAAMRENQGGWSKILSQR